MLCLGSLLVATVYTELKWNRIPNWLTIPALLIGLLAAHLTSGPALITSVLGVVIGFGFLFIFYMFGGLGGGDVKLMGAVGALVGYPRVLDILFYTAVIGGAMAILAIIWNRGFWRRMGARWRRFSAGRDEEREPLEPAEPITLPYGLAIVGGCLLDLVVSGW